MPRNKAPAPTPAGAKVRWTQPIVTDLPVLTELTLQSAGPPPAGDAITVSGGSSGLVF